MTRETDTQFVENEPLAGIIGGIRDCDSMGGECRAGRTGSALKDRRDVRWTVTGRNAGPLSPCRVGRAQVCWCSSRTQLVLRTSRWRSRHARPKSPVHRDVFAVSTPDDEGAARDGRPSGGVPGVHTTGRPWASTRHGATRIASGLSPSRLKAASGIPRDRIRPRRRAREPAGSVRLRTDSARARPTLAAPRTDSPPQSETIVLCLLHVCFAGKRVRFVCEVPGFVTRGDPRSAAPVVNYIYGRIPKRWTAQLHKVVSECVMATRAPGRWAGLLAPIAS